MVNNILMEAKAQHWNPSDYAQHAGFVPELTREVWGLLAPRAGERVLDLGCGDGVLSARLMAAGCQVVGVDSSAEQVAAACARGVDARVGDAARLSFSAEFDAVFSNAALHWVADHDAMLAGVRAALRPGGRFVAELGGHGCVAVVRVALAAVFARRGLDVAPFIPWYFPNVDEYAARLTAAGFEVQTIELRPRPTPLPTDLAGWLHTFAGSIFEALPAKERSAAEREVIALAAPALRDRSGRWTADYTRLRFAARVR